MSLLNNVLRDLQTRGAFGLPPLTGLEPVADTPDQQRKHALLLSLLAVLTIAAVLVIWRPLADGRGIASFAHIMGDAPTQPSSHTNVQSNPITSAPVEPAIAVTGDDLRELLMVENSSNEIPVQYDDDVVATLAESPLKSATVVESAPTDPLPTAELPTVTELPVMAVLPAITESPEVIGSPPTTIISRREAGDDTTSAIVARGLAAMRSNDLRTAERLFREALAVDSGDHAIWSYLYGVLVRARQPTAAEQTLQRGLISANEPAALAKLYARMLLDRGENGAAVSLLKIHRPAPASDIEYDAFLAALLQQQGKYAEAGEIYQKLLTVEPGPGSVWIGLAMSHDSLGNRADAQSAFEHALSTDSLKTPLARYARRRSEELMAYD